MADEEGARRAVLSVRTLIMTDKWMANERGDDEVAEMNDERMKSSPSISAYARNLLSRWV